jgi:LmbE family N-acetylglucosaminyl deacetylase
VLGVTEHHIAGLPDGALADHTAAGIDWVGRLLDDVRPDTIVTFGADGITFHPDHVAVHHWVTEAWWARGCPGRLMYAAPTVEHLVRFGARYEEWGIYMGDERPTGVPAERLALRVRLTGLELDRKVAALRTMATQTGGAVADLGLALYADMNAEESYVAATASATVAPGAAVDGKGDGEHARIARAADRRRQPAGDHRRIGARPVGRGDRVQRRRRPR